METRHIDRLLGLLELAGQTTTVRVWPALDTGLLSDPTAANREGAPPPPVPWYAHLYVQQGFLQFCTIFSSIGEKILTGAQALTFLQQQGRLLYETFAEPASPQAVSAFESPPSGPPSSGPLPNRGGAFTSPLPPAPAPPPVFQAPSLEWIPARTHRGMMLAQGRPDEQLERSAWRVLALVDGQRRVRDIAAVLGWHPSEVLKRLQLLYQKQLIG